MKGQAAGRLGLCLVFGLCMAACIAPPPPSPVTLTSRGGDAWSFGKLIEATVAPGACETVSFTSPRGMVHAAPQDGRIIARVPLLPGDNLVVAACEKNGVRQGPPAVQHWFLRLED